VCYQKDYSLTPSVSAVAETGCLAAGPSHAIPSLQCTAQYKQISHTQLLFNSPVVQELLQVKLVLKRKLAGIVVAQILQSEWPSRHPTNIIASKH